MTTNEKVYVHDGHIEIISHVKISEQVEIYIAATEQTATLFFNEFEMEFHFNAITARIVNEMIDSSFPDQILYAQMLKNHAITAVKN